VRAPAGRVALHRVWKRFRYGDTHTRLRDAVPAFVRRALGRTDPDAGVWHGTFWALRDVSFTVGPGQALGLIGPNGAGKSTVLKLLTGILRPTSGAVRVQGRVGALIEVAAGFHPDLTGRENVFLQGVIMGMPRREIARKFEPIVEFSGIGPFIDTPVKRYSSGMQARLGFAIAAHLEPEVLLVDEVLAVGDASFQARAMARVAELVRQEIPVVVVSHQLDAITALCTEAILLDRGRVVHQGSPRDCIAAYLTGVAAAPPPGEGDGAIRIEALRLSTEVVPSGGRLRVALGCGVRPDGWTEPETVQLRIRLAQTGETLYETGTQQRGVALPRSGRFDVAFELQMNVAPGMYLVESFAWDRMMGRQSFAGPSRHVEVTGGAPFDGLVQMNAVVEVAAAGAREPARAPGEARA
jgi:ABC-type polysaccharide/polyol phosphate transport system ATPase subunit